MYFDFDAAKDGDLGILTGGSTKKNFKFDRVYTPRDNQGTHGAVSFVIILLAFYFLKHVLNQSFGFAFIVDVFADASPLVSSVLDGY